MISYEGTEYAYFTQPIVDISKNKTIVHELLLRTFDKKDGQWKLPSSFQVPIELQIDLANETLENLNSKNISINLTQKQFEDGVVCDKIIDFYQKSAVNNLTIEMVKVSSYAIFKRMQEKYHKEGIILGIDDVGSDNKLQDVMPLLDDVDTIKFASQNIRHLSQIKVLNQLNYWFEQAEKRHLLFTFEGVEGLKDIRMAKKLGITRCQGYFFSKPVLPADLPDSLR